MPLKSFVVSYLFFLKKYKNTNIYLKNKIKKIQTPKYLETTL